MLDSSVVVVVVLYSYYVLSVRQLVHVVAVGTSACIAPAAALVADGHATAVHCASNGWIC
jgi:hypothetical protein